MQGTATQMTFGLRQGTDLAIVLVGFTAVGWWLDRHFGWYPRATVTGAILGVVGGLANISIERVIRAVWPHLTWQIRISFAAWC